MNIDTFCLTEYFVLLNWENRTPNQCKLERNFKASAGENYRSSASSNPGHIGTSLSSLITSPVMLHARMD